MYDAPFNNFNIIKIQRICSSSTIAIASRIRILNLRVAAICIYIYICIQRRSHAAGVNVQYERLIFNIKRTRVAAMHMQRTRLFNSYSR